MIHVRTSFLVVALVTLSTSLTSARILRSDPGYPDSVIISSGQTHSPLPGSISVYLTNDEPVTTFEITLRLRPDGALFDSASFKGSRLSRYGIHSLRLTPAVITLFVLPSSGDLIPPGSGALCRIFISYPPDLPLQSLTIDTTTYQENLVEHSTYFTDSTLNGFCPAVRPGLLEVLPPCCMGKRGNIDGSVDDNVDISDLSALIDYLYLSPNNVPACLEEADLDSPPDRSIDISDLSALIDYLYIRPTTAVLPECP
jgi:hypothetical protein